MVNGYLLADVHQLLLAVTNPIASDFNTPYLTQQSDLLTPSVNELH